MNNDQEITMNCKLQNLTEQPTKHWPQIYNGYGYGEILFSWFIKEPGPLTVTGLRFRSPINGSDWTNAPKTFAVMGYKGKECKPGQCRCLYPQVELFRVQNSEFTGPGQTKKWFIPCEKRDAYHCYMVKTYELYRRFPATVRLEQVTFFHSTGEKPVTVKPSPSRNCNRGRGR